tara:strand:+ start:352 stop:549 length:198 start_codon:yes stop_codon:yes gene_type:complete
MYIKNLGLGTTIRKNQMEYITETNLIILWAFGFVSHTAYTLGKRVGIEDAIDYMAEQGMIDLDDE